MSYGLAENVYEIVDVSVGSLGFSIRPHCLQIQFHFLFPTLDAFYSLSALVRASGAVVKGSGGAQAPASLPAAGGVGAQHAGCRSGRLSAPLSPLSPGWPPPLRPQLHRPSAMPARCCVAAAAFVPGIRFWSLKVSSVSRTRAGAVRAQWLLVPASVRPGLVREMPFPLIVACMFLFPSRLVIFDLLSERAILPCWALGVSVFL